jgi:archaellum biogenesis protein FlaJ (TadC family)
MAIPFFATKTFTTSMQTVAACAGIFMAMSFSHSSMRKTIIETGGLSYLEYYYVFLYILICIIIMYIILSYIVPRKSMLARDPKPVVVFSILPLYLFVNFIVTILTFFN